VIESEIMGPGKWNKNNEDTTPEESSFATGNVTTTNVDEWDQDLPVSKRFFDDDQQDTVNKAVFDMARQAINSRDENALDIYAGGFDNSFVFAWPDSSRLVIINSLPTPTALEPNLYGINLK